MTNSASSPAAMYTQGIGFSAIEAVIPDAALATPWSSASTMFGIRRDYVRPPTYSRKGSRTSLPCSRSVYATSPQGGRLLLEAEVPAGWQLLAWRVERASK